MALPDIDEREATIALAGEALYMSKELGDLHEDLESINKAFSDLKEINERTADAVEGLFRIERERASEADLEKGFEIESARDQQVEPEDGITTTTEKKIGKQKSNWLLAITAVVAGIIGFKDDIVELGEKLWEWIDNTIIKGIGNAFNGIVNSFNGTVEDIEKKVLEIVIGISKGMDDIVKKIEKGFNGIINWFKGKLGIGEPTRTYEKGLTATETLTAAGEHGGAFGFTVDADQATIMQTINKVETRQDAAVLRRNFEQETGKNLDEYLKSNLSEDNYQQAQDILNKAPMGSGAPTTLSEERKSLKNQRQAQETIDIRLKEVNRDLGSWSDRYTEILTPDPTNPNAPPVDATDPKVQEKLNKMIQELQQLRNERSALRRLGANPYSDVSLTVPSEPIVKDHEPLDDPSNTPIGAPIDVTPQPGASDPGTTILIKRPDHWGPPEGGSSTINIKQGDQTTFVGGGQAPFPGLMPTPPATRPGDNPTAMSELAMDHVNA